MTISNSYNVSTDFHRFLKRLCSFQIFFCPLFLLSSIQGVNIQLMTFDEVNTRIDQPMEHDIHLGCLGEYHVPWVDQSLYSPKLKVINCFII